MIKKFNSEKRSAGFYKRNGNRSVRHEDNLASGTMRGYCIVQGLLEVMHGFNEDASELTCQIKVTAVTRGKEYSEYYFATYNKAYDFYSIYAYHE